MDSFLETLKNLGPGRLMMMMMTFFGLIIFFIFIAVKSSAPSMTLLYGGLSTADSTEIAAKLDNANVAFSLNENGTEVSVPARSVGKARMLLAQDGLPRQATMGYELFDQKQSFGTTSFQQNINALRALEGELARTIGTIDNVRTARVHLVLPRRELFSREKQQASASAFLNLQNAAGIGSEQIQAIQHLIAAAVPALDAGRVAVIDQNGNLLARGEEHDSTAASARDGEEMRRKYEMRLNRAVEEMVGRVVGYGKVRSNITAKLNFDVISRNSESYDPEGQVVRSTQTTTDESSDTTGSNATVSVSNNLPGLGATGGDGTGLGSKTSRTEEVTNFEISKTIESVVRSSGDVEKLSIAVLVDGDYETDTTVEKPEDAGDDWVAPRKYVERSPAQLEKIAALVKSAVGFDEMRGDTIEVVNMRFAESDFVSTPLEDNSIMGFARSELLGVAETLALSIVAALVILLVLRPLATHFSAGSGGAAGGGGGGMRDPAMLPGGAQQAQLPGPDGAAATGAMMPGAAAAQQGDELETMIDMSSVEGKVKASSVQKISELVTNHPNEAVSVIRQWISQEG